MTNLGIVKRVFDLFSNGELDQILDHIAADFEWTYYGSPEIEWAGRYLGHSGVREFFGIVSRCLTIEHFETTEFIDAGHKIVVRGVSHARLLSNDARYKAHWINIFTLGDGKIRALEDLYDTGSVLLALRGKTPVLHVEAHHESCS
jgi:ketosteroid isomerase-like protein